jgi:hypothetical protein
MLTGPIDAVVAIHNAFRQDIKLIDAAALDSARGKPGRSSSSSTYTSTRRTSTCIASSKNASRCPTRARQSA